MASGLLEYCLFALSSQQRCGIWKDYQSTSKAHAEVLQDCIVCSLP